LSYVIQETSPARNIPSINAFFDKVLVMAEDKKVKENQLGLLQRIANLSKGIADLSTLEGF
jgi:glycyl-tRNA synthetase beta subunit